MKPLLKNLTEQTTNMTDFVTRKQRLSKKEPHVDFNLADNDDFFGFSQEEQGFTFTQTVLALIIGLPVLYGIVYVLLAMTPNI
mgnify:CR=1 FL=1